MHNSLFFSILTGIRHAFLYVILVGCMANAAHAQIIDIVPKISENNFDSSYKKLESNAYREFVLKNIDSSGPIPYFPYVPLNPAILKPGVQRIYLGKLDTKKTNNFIFIAVGCRPVTGTNQNGTLLHYQDNPGTPTLLNGVKTPGKPDGYSIKLEKGNAQTDRVVYRRINSKLIEQYRKNFKSYMDGRKIPNPYPVCFVLENRRVRRTNPKYRVIRPVYDSALNSTVVTGKNKRILTQAGGTSSRKNFYFLPPGVVILFLEDDTCCQTPPETGNIYN